MNEGRTVFSQVVDFVPRHTFRRRVQRYRGDYGVRRFTCWQQFLAMLFAQLTYRESLRDIAACLGAAPGRIYPMGFTGPVSRSTLADANERRDWRIYADVAQALIAEARQLYADEPLDVELDHTVYALDPAPLRRIRYRDPESNKTLVFLTNDFALPALTITGLYRNRWQVELFFKWIKQHLRIKAFYGTSPNAVKTQIWIAISAYVLVAILRKRLNIDRDLYTILQILSVYPFEKVPLFQLLTVIPNPMSTGSQRKQLTLFDL